MSTRAPIFGYLVVALGCAAAIAALSLSSVVQGVLIGLLGACMFEVIQPAASEWPYIKLAVDARLRGRRRALIRLSISYLYRIKIGNDYLLIRGSRIPDQYQPIGGVFKRFPEATETLVGLSVLDDDAMPIDTSSEQDLRIRVPATHLMAFLRWYESGKQREVETWREFYEEMVRPGLVSPEVFPHLLTRHLRQHRTPIRWSEHFQCWELLLAEIVEPILTPAQRAALEDTKAMQDAQLLWVGDPLIRSTGYDKTRHERVAKISETSCWIL